MGGSVSVALSEVVIPVERVRDALAAVNEVFDAGPPPPEDGFPNLISALNAWGYEAYTHPDGAVEIEAFSGEKWGDHEDLYDALAPYLPEGAEICIAREDVELSYRKQGDRLIFTWYGVNKEKLL